MSVDPLLVPDGPVSVALGGWQSARHGLAYIIVAKAEFAILQGECALLASPSAVRVADELLPQKPRVDVLVVGSAYAERPVARHVAYLSIGPLEKAIELCTDRWVDARNTIHDGSLFKSMPITWERAAGGHDTINPVGIAPVRSAQGRLNLPNIQPLATDPAAPDWTVPPTSLGPIPAAWAVRAGLLGGHPPPNFKDRPVLADDFNFAYLQSAPRDQQPTAVDVGDPIFLEGLHPTLPKITTRLPRFKVRATVDDVELPLTCDTFVIDTDAQRITLLWKGSAWARDLSGASIRVHLSSDFAILAPPAPAAAPSKRALSEETATLDLPQGNMSGLPFGGHARPTVATSAMPAIGAAPRATQPVAAPPSAPVAAPPPTIPPSTAPPVTAPQPPTVPPPPQKLAPPPPPMRSSPPLTSASAVPPIPAPAVVPHVPMSPIAAPPLQAPPRQLGGTQLSGAPPQPPAPVSLVSAQSPDVRPTYLKEAKAAEAPSPSRLAHAADAVKGGAFQASVAAAAAAQAVEPKVKSTRKPPVEAVPAAPADLVELLWHHADAPSNLPKRAGKEADEWLPRKSDAKTQTDPDRARVARALARSSTLDQAGVKRAIGAAASTDGVLQDVIASARGELSFVFDPFELLAITLALAEPHAATDRRLREAVDASATLKDAPKAIPTQLLDNAVARVRQAFANATTRQVPPDYLQTNAERWLAEERKYVTRQVKGDTCFLGAITPDEGGPPITVFLSTQATAFLPGVPSFEAKLFGRASLQLDAQRLPQLWVLALGATMG